MRLRITGAFQLCDLRLPEAEMPHPVQPGGHPPLHIGRHQMAFAGVGLDPVAADIRQCDEGTKERKPGGEDQGKQDES